MSIAPLGSLDPRTIVSGNMLAYEAARNTASAPVGTAVNPLDPSVPSTAQVAAAGELQAAVDTLNRATQLARDNIEFSIDQDSGRVVVKLVDNDTHEVIRQIPSQEALELSRSLEKNQGLILNGKA